MKKALSLLAMMSAIIPDSQYLMNDKKHKSKPQKKWNNELKCYTTNGKKVDKEGNYIIEGSSK
jgi:hypothetical protein